MPRLRIRRVLQIGILAIAGWFVVHNILWAASEAEKSEKPVDPGVADLEAEESEKPVDPGIADFLDVSSISRIKEVSHWDISRLVDKLDDSPLQSNGSGDTSGPVTPGRGPDVRLTHFRLGCVALHLEEAAVDLGASGPPRKAADLGPGFRCSLSDGYKVAPGKPAWMCSPVNRHPKLEQYSQADFKVFGLMQERFKGIDLFVDIGGLGHRGLAAALQGVPTLVVQPRLSEAVSLVRSAQLNNVSDKMAFLVNAVGARRGMVKLVSPSIHQLTVVDLNKTKANAYIRGLTNESYGRDLVSGVLLSDVLQVAEHTFPALQQVREDRHRGPLELAINVALDPNKFQCDALVSQPAVIWRPQYYTIKYMTVSLKRSRWCREPMLELYNYADRHGLMPLHVNDGMGARTLDPRSMRKWPQTVTFVHKDFGLGI